MAFFIPWRVVAEESGAAHFGFGGAMLLDLPGPALRLLTAVADFHFLVILRVRGDDGARAIGANDDAAAAAAAVELRGHRQGAASKDQRHRVTAACSLSDISGWRDGVLYPLAGGRRRLWRGAARPARAAWVVQRLLAARW